MNQSHNTTHPRGRKHSRRRANGMIARLKNLAPGAVVLMLVGIVVLAYLLWMFYTGYSQF